MKKSIFILTAFLISSLSVAQTGSIDNLFDKYSEKEGFTSVYISGKMLSMLGSLNKESENKDNILLRIKSIRILSQDSLSTEKVNFYDELGKKLDFSVYEELMVVKENHEVTKFLIRQTGNTISELLLVTGGTGGNTLISIRGDLNLKELSEISKTIGVDELQELEDIENRKPQK